MQEKELYHLWNEKKQKLNTRDTLPSFREGEIWWCALGKNIGREIYGKGNAFTRPVYVLKKVAREMFVGIPLTSQEKHGTWFHPLLTRNQKRYAVLPQLRLYSAKRLLEYIVELPESDQHSIKNALGMYLGI